MGNNSRRRTYGAGLVPLADLQGPSLLTRFGSLADIELAVSGMSALPLKAVMLIVSIDVR